MSTWFDRQGGAQQGRIAPSVRVDAADGTYSFVLGSDGDTELATLSDGDYTEIKQTVDLTDIDIIQATINTAGVAMSQRTDNVGLQVETDTLFLFPMDRDFEGATNHVLTGFDLEGVPDIESGDETYSSAGSKCRVIPVGITARLAGFNTPQAFTPDPLTEYTFEAWINFDCDSHAVSLGIDPVVFECMTAGAGGGGLRIELLGGAGHTWSYQVTHNDGAATTVVNLPGYAITTNIGWHMVSIVYDGASVGTELELYIDKVSQTTGAMATDVDAPDIGEDVQIGDPLLYGSIDQFKLSNTAHALATVQSDYDSCVDAPTTYDHTWKMQILIDDVLVDSAERIITDTEEEQFVDFRVPVRNLDLGGGWAAVTGNHTVAVRLKLEEV